LLCTGPDEASVRNHSLWSHEEFVRFSFWTLLNRWRGGKIFDPDLQRAEQVFLAPPFTPEVAAAVGLISTRVPFH
jgi:hypothetical protein